MDNIQLTPESLARQEIQRLIRLNDTLQADADTPNIAGIVGIERIRETSQTILAVGTRMSAIDPEVYLGEARRLHAVNEQLEPMVALDSMWMIPIHRNAVLIAQLMEAIPRAAFLFKRQEWTHEYDS